MTRLEYVPTSDESGVPDNVPFAVLKLAQRGIVFIDHVSVRPSGSLPVGRKEYALPTDTEVDGVPETVGGRFELPPLLPLAETVIENGGSVAQPVLLCTEIFTFPQVPVVLDEPWSLPVLTLKSAHQGLLMIEKRRAVAELESRTVGVKL